MTPGGPHHSGRAVLKDGPEDQRREDSQNGMPPVPSGGNAVVGGVRDMDDGRGSFLPLDAAGSGIVYIIRGGDGARFASGPHSDSLWEGIGWETALGSHGPCSVATYLYDGLLVRRGGV